MSWLLFADVVNNATFYFQLVFVWCLSLKIFNITAFFWLRYLKLVKRCPSITSQLFCYFTGKLFAYIIWHEDLNFIAILSFGLSQKYYTGNSFTAIAFPIFIVIAVKHFIQWKHKKSTVVWLNDSLVQTWTLENGLYSFGGDLAKRLIAADSALELRSLLARSPPTPTNTCILLQG